MIAKISKGTNFQGAVNYILDNEKGTELLASEGLRTLSNDSIISSFIAEAKLNSSVSKFVGHISLAFSAKDAEKLTNEFMVAIAKEYLQKMKIENTQFLIARHHDKQHPHVHICFNRVDFDGKTISQKNDMYRSYQICKELTIKHNLYIAQGKERVKTNRLREPDKTKYQIYDALKITTGIARNWEELKHLLEKEGINVDFKYKGDTNEIQGVKFTKNDFSFSGSKVDKAYSFSKIDFLLRGNEIEFNRMEGNDINIETEDDFSFGKSVLKTILDIASTANAMDGGNEQENELNSRKRKRR